MPKGDNIQVEHKFGKSHRNNYDASTLRCHECGDPKDNDELNSDGYKYICDDCMVDED